MAIEFRCTGCDKLLRVGDHTGGLPAKCPECGLLQNIPQYGSELDIGPKGPPDPSDPDYQWRIAAKRKSSEDTMAVTVGYSRGGMLSYSLHAFSPYEGYRLHITGTEGRIEMFDLATPTWDYDKSKQEIHVMRQFEKRQTYTVDMSYDGGHGGGDTRLLDAIFLEQNDDPLGCTASSWDGALSIMTGVAANKSIETGRAINVGQLLDEIKPQPVIKTEPAIV